MTAALSFAEHAVTALAYLFIVAGVIAVLMHATGLTQQRRPKPKHRAGDPPPDAGRYIDAMRDLQARGAARLRRAMEEVKGDG